MIGNYIWLMKSNFVSLHPYFKVNPGKIDAIKAMLPRFVEKTATEKGNLFYEFTMNGDELFCREAYENGEHVLAHLDNIGGLLAEAMKIADLTETVEKLKKPLAHLKPAFFTLEASAGNVKIRK
jgi:quinol monooxygenase YgiN